MNIDDLFLPIFSRMPYVLCILCIIHITYLIVNSRMVKYNHNVGYAQLVICIGYWLAIYTRAVTSLSTVLYESIYFSTLIALNSEFFMEQFNETKRKMVSFANFSKQQTVTKEERDYIAEQFLNQNPNADLLNLSIRRAINTIRILSWCIMMICLTLIILIGH